jgi:hypothetical protein
LLSSSDERLPPKIAVYETIQRYNKSSSRIIFLETEVEKHLAMQAMSREEMANLKASNDELSSHLDDLSQKMAAL